MSRKHKASQSLVGDVEVNAPNSATFLGLPPELRAAILKYLLRTERGRIQSTYWGTQALLDLAVLRTCKQIYVEGLAVFRIHNKVVYKHDMRCNRGPWLPIPWAEAPTGQTHLHGRSLRPFYQYYHAIKHFSNIEFILVLGSCHIKQEEAELCQLSGFLSDMRTQLVAAANAGETPQTIHHHFKFDTFFLLRTWTGSRYLPHRRRPPPSSAEQDEASEKRRLILGSLRSQVQYTLVDHKQKLSQNPGLREVTFSTNLDDVTDNVSYFRIDEMTVAFKDSSKNKMGRIQLTNDDGTSPDDFDIHEQVYDASRDIQDL